MYFPGPKALDAGQKALSSAGTSVAGCDAGVFQEKPVNYRAAGGSGLALGAGYRTGN